MENELIDGLGITHQQQRQIDEQVTKVFKGSPVKRMNDNQYNVYIMSVLDMAARSVGAQHGKDAIIKFISDSLDEVEKQKH